MRKTKIVCTIGPVSQSKEMLEKLIKAGMNIARLNFSHGNYKEFASIIKNIRTLNKKLGTNVAILQDLQGLKIRIGKLPEGKRMLHDGEKITFTTDSKILKGEIPVDYKGFVKDVKVGDRVFVVDGKVELKVLQKKGNRAVLQVIHGGEIASRKGMNIPDTSITASARTEKDMKDIQFGIRQKVDYVGMSFVRNKKDISEIRHYLAKLKRPDIKILVKIETAQAIENLEEIIETADALIIARGDLAVEISLEKMPLVQKRITSMANTYGKPVITATEMMASMVLCPVPTRAEVSDVANAILEGTDAVMLSNETSVGKYPVEAVMMMDKIAREIENNCLENKENEMIPDFEEEKERYKISRSLSCNGVEVAEELQAKCLLVFTMKGFTALEVARCRPSMPIIVFTPFEKVKKELAFTYGVNDIYIFKNFKNRMSSAIDLLVKEKKLKSNDVIVITFLGKKEKMGITDEILVVTLP